VATLAESRAATLAVRENTEKPKLVTLTCDSTAKQTWARKSRRVPESSSEYGRILFIGLNCTTDRGQAAILRTLKPFARAADCETQRRQPRVDEAERRLRIVTEEFVSFMRISPHRASGVRRSAAARRGA
jgi:S-methylmethionine-dependent homocysteine/selenocysteine methylase